ncbi:TPA: hypothetical protein J1540_004860, partial [Escherichia coli]|nr:hypothetical protein [Escherichia coli]HBB0141966.1 hypothetical protein [Escherichia coli]
MPRSGGKNRRTGNGKKAYEGELIFALQLAREMGRPDWRAMLAGMSSTEY